MESKDCRKFDTCSAAICPLDALWKTAVHLQGERVCHYLTIGGKAGVEERYAGVPEYQAVTLVAPEVMAAFPAIRKRVEQAAKTGFRGKELLRG